jgi:hypothetical protein
MTLPFNDVDADGAVSLEEFLGQVPCLDRRHGPRRRWRHHDRRFRPEPRLRAHYPVRPDGRTAYEQRGFISWDLKGSGSTAAGSATCPNRRCWHWPSPPRKTTPASTAATPNAYAPTTKTAPQCSTKWQSEEDTHRQRLIELHRARFGEVIPLIRREHVAGYYARRPVWLVENLGLDRIRDEAAAMEQDAEAFYLKAARAARRCRHPQASGRSCPGRGQPPRQRNRAAEAHLDALMPARARMTAPTGNSC